MTYGAPANLIETVNTVGLAIYARQIARSEGSAIEVKTEAPGATLIGRTGAAVRKQKFGGFGALMPNSLIDTLSAALKTEALTESAFAGPHDDALIAAEKNDYSTAIRHWHALAEHGNASAHYNMGVCYANGYGVPEDYGEAAKHYLVAAEQGDAHAQHALGISYGLGKGVLQDYVRAHMWLNLAASRYPTSEHERREHAVKARDLLGAVMTHEQVAEAQRLAREWKVT